MIAHGTGQESPSRQPRRVLIYAAGQDTNGNGKRISEGFGRLAPDWRVDMIALKQSWIRYPEQHGGGRRDRKRLARKLAGEADVLHLFNGLMNWRDLDGLGKPVILHHHGTSFRRDHVNLAKGANALGMTQIASTLDLVILEPGVEWLPAIYNMEELQAIRERVHPAEREVVRIAHAPTNRRIKGTDAVIAAVERLRESVEVEFDLIERETWADCLERIALADIVVDQLILGHGSLAVEAWSMGAAVVAGIAPENGATRAEMVRRWGRPPFVEAQPDTLTAILKRLVKSRQARIDAAARGRAHVERYHDERAVVPRLQEIYAKAGRTRQPVSTWRGVKPWRKAA